MIRRLLQAFNGSTTPTLRSRRSRLYVELLESRRVLSATPGTVTLVNGELVICGTDADNEIGIVNSPNGYVVVADFLADNRVFADTDVTSIRITGEDGDDRLIAVDMNIPVTIEGGDGADLIFGGSGSDTLGGGAGDDIIYGLVGDDLIVGGDGDDFLLGRAGADTITGGDGDDIIVGDEGNDTIDAGAGVDSVFAAAGNDDVVGGDGDDLIVGGDGDDTISGAGGADLIFGLAGSDTLDGGDDGDRIYGGLGVDTVMGQGGIDQLFGGEGSDILSGGADSDFLAGGASDDVLIGGTGGDSLNGQADNDIIVAGSSAAESNASTLLNVATAWANRASYEDGITAVQSQLVPNTSDDAALDTISGAEGRDAFFTSGAEDTIDQVNFDENVVGGDLLAVDDSFIIESGATLTTIASNSLIVNDVNPVAGDLTVDATPVTAPTFGTLTLNTDGTFTYEHTGNVGDVDTFVYEITNADQTTSQATVTISVQNTTVSPNTFAISEHTADNALIGTVQPTLSLGSDVIYELSAGSSQSSALSLVADDHFEGSLSAPVVLIDYQSYQCSSCRFYHENILRELKSEFTEELLVVNRHLPLGSIFPHSVEAALYVEAAAQQGMFSEMADLLYANQSIWGALADPTSTFEQYARDLGLNVGEVQAAVSDSVAAASVADDSTTATDELGLTGTPSFFLDAVRLQNGEVPDLQTFQDRIQQQLDANPQAISLNRLTGELRVADSSLLDFEGQDSIVLSVVASDGSNAETISVTVNLTDAADETGIPVLPDGAVPSTTATGLQVYDLELGDGASPVETDRVQLGYVGYRPDGSIFDSNENVEFNLGSLIAGFSEGVQGMEIGGTRRIIIPPNLGYGSGGNPGAGIGGTDTIVFDVVLRDIVTI